MKQPSVPATTSKPLESLCIDAVRVLAMDAVQRANSGHPGTPMALAPLGYLLWTRYLRHDPADPSWPDRDRFVLSCGHASMFLYALLYLAGYDLDLEDLKNFRQWDSRTPGHPEFGHTPGVETTTGPLGQGVGNAVGMAIAEAHLAARFNRAALRPVDHRTWFVASDGDLMEGIAHEAASLAGHLGLGKLIGFYDDNGITIEGSTRLAFSEDVAQRFHAYGWHVTRVADINDLEALSRAIDAAVEETERPSLVIVRSHIAYGSPNKQDSHAAHGAPLGEDEVARTRENLGWPEAEPFVIPAAVLESWRQCRARGAALHAASRETWRRYADAHPDDAEELQRRLRGDLPEGWEADLPDFHDAAPMATRKASGKTLQALAGRVPELLGGSADLAPSNNTLLEGETDLDKKHPGGRNLHFGIREHAMGAVVNGMALHGGVRPYGGTFLVFSDYMRPSIRLAALMGLDVVYVFTHDSIGLGEDGPTHQPVETLAALRAIPGLTVLRPADAVETVAAWRLALEQGSGPVALVLTRQNVPIVPRLGSDESVERGAYVLQEASQPPGRVLLLASGSEVALACEARERLEAGGIPTRVVSMPSHERFAAQPPATREAVLPAAVRVRVAVEAAVPMPWYRWVGTEGAVVGVERFGASAPWEVLYREYGLTAAAVERRARQLLDALG